jgi:hypothetical protein
MNRVKRNTHMFLVGKPERRKPVKRPRYGWVDNIKVDIGEREWGGNELE